MINTKNIYFLVLLLAIEGSFSLKSFGQQSYPQHYFRSPLNIPLVLAGSFGELRSNHFHSGIDIKTQGKIGKNVYAVANGYVSRIKISPWGYGNALYITYSNGYTSVYGHLLHYNKQIDSLVKARQYALHKFAIEIFPKPNSIKVRKGQFVAKSGNSGGSGGPHLHFEIRETATGNPINPLLFGYKIADHQYPKIKKFRIYEYDKNNNETILEFPLKQSGKNVQLLGNDTIIVSGDKIFPAIEAYDQWDAAVNKNGLYELSLYLNDKLFFRFVADKINFKENRYINSYIDYKTYRKDKKRFQRTYVEPNNKLSNIKEAVNHGLLNLKPDSLYRLKIVAEDYAGQQSILQCALKKDTKKAHFNPRKKGVYFSWQDKNIYTNKDIYFKIPAGALYDDQYFWVTILKNTYSPYGKLYEIYDYGVPLHSYCTLKLKLDSNLKAADYSKACILRLNNDDKSIYEGGHIIGNFITTKTRNFGKYYMDIDSIAPTIIPINIYNNKNITQQSTIGFKVQDEMSGLKKYSASLDGKWILLAYDPKKDHLYYRIDSHFPAGKHLFSIEVWDKKGNHSSKTFNLIRN